MKKIFLTTIIALLTSCTNTHKITQNDEIKLFKLIKQIKRDVKDGNISSLKSYMVDSYINRRIITGLENIPLRRMVILTTPPKFNQNGASNIVALTFNDATSYLKVNYIFDKDWKIKSLENLEK